MMAARRRKVSISETAEGMVRIEAVLPAEEAVVVRRALDSAMEASAEDSDLGARQADALVNMAQGYLQQAPRTMGAAHELVVVTTPQQLEGKGDGIGGFLPDGTPVPVRVAQSLAATGARVDVVVGEDGEILDVGRRTRGIPAAIGRALWLRDGGCRVPGCGRKRHVHAHHIHAWADGGPTKLSNLVLTCSTHHRLIHEGRLRVEGADQESASFTFLDEFGRVLPRVPGIRRSGRDLADLEGWLTQESISVAAKVSEPRWDGSRLRLGEAVSAVLAGPGFTA